MANEEHVEILKKGVDAWNKWRESNPDIIPDLKGALHLHGADLRGANFSRAILIDAYLKVAHLRGADLRGADLSGADLRGADLSRVNLNGADLSRAVLRKADLRGVNYNPADFSGTNLSEASLNRLNVSLAFLFKANFGETHLRGLNLNQTIFIEADLSGANLSNVNLSMTILSKAILRNAILSKAILIEADLRGADLSWANLSEANLSWADLSGAKLRFADLRWAHLSEVHLKAAHLETADLSGADLSGADLSGADLSEARLLRTNLQGATITGACLYGTARDDWKLDGIQCDYIFWDSDNRIRTPKEGSFKKGEFEALYKQLPTFEYLFEHCCGPIDTIIMDKVVQEIRSLHPDFELQVNSIDFRANPRIVFSVRQAEFIEKALSFIKAGYEKQIAALEGKQEALHQCFLEALDKVGSKKIEIGKIEGDVLIANNIAFNQIWNEVSQDVNLDGLAKELAEIRLALKKEPDSSESVIVSGKIAEAEIEAKKGRGAKVIEYLNQIIDLKPNIIGIGININKILEKLRVSRCDNH